MNDLELVVCEKAIDERIVTVAHMNVLFKSIQTFRQKLNWRRNKTARSANGNLESSKLARGVLLATNSLHEDFV